MPSSHQRHIWTDPGIFLLALVQFFLMGAYSVLLSSLELYLTGRYHISAARASTIVAVFISPLLALPLICGYIGDRIINHYSATIIGMFTVLAGYLILFFSTHLSYDFVGMASVQAGISLLEPNFYVIIGRYSPKESAYRHGAFILNYVGLNFGAIFGMITTGYLIHSYGNHSTFIFAASLACCGIVTLFFARHKVATPTKRPSFTAYLITFVILIAAIILATILLHFSYITNALLIVVGLLAIGVVILLISKYQNLAREKLTAFLVLCLLAVGFFAFYNLSSSLLMYFIQHNLLHTIHGIHFPAETIYASEAVFVTIFGLIAVQAWLTLDKKGHTIYIPAKTFISMLFIATAFFLLFIGTLLPDASGKLPMFWMLLYFMFLALGEICISPLGYSMVGELAPKEHEGLMQGIWYLALGLAAGISGFIAANSVSPTLLLPQSTKHYTYVFLSYTIALILISIVAFILKPRLTQVFEKGEVLKS